MWWTAPAPGIECHREIRQRRRKSPLLFCNAAKDVSGTSRHSLRRNIVGRFRSEADNASAKSSDRLFWFNARSHLRGHKFRVGYASRSIRPIRSYFDSIQRSFRKTSSTVASNDGRERATCTDYNAAVTAHRVPATRRGTSSLGRQLRWHPCKFYGHQCE